METLMQDIRYALRLLRKSPGYAAAAILTLALGIGANTAIFSVADAFLRKPIYFPEIDRLVMLINNMPGEDVGRNSVAPADYLAWKANSQSFEKMAAYEWSDVNLTGSGEPQKLISANITANFFDVLRVPLDFGRAFLPEEEQPGRDQEVILSHGLWVRQFASDPNILGKKVTIDGVSMTIVGVARDDFDFPISSQIWLPLTITDKEKSLRSSHYVWPVARLRSGVSIDQAQAEMSAIQANLQKDYPSEEKGWDAHVLLMRYFAADQYSRQYSILLLVAVGFVLLIACANIANVQLARAASRHREFAVREAIGASRGRIVRQLLTESLLLSLTGAIVGLVFAKWALAMIVTNMPPDVGRYIAAWKHIQLDLDALIYTGVIAVAAGVISGLAPAFQGAKLDLSGQLKDGSRAGAIGTSRRVLRNALVVGEVAASLILLVGAGLTVKGVHALLASHRNVVPETLLTMRVVLPDSKYKEHSQQIAFYDRLLEELNSSPAVKGVSIATVVPFSEGAIRDGLRVEGIPPQPGEVRFIGINCVDSDYFRTMNIPIREGSAFDVRDGANAPRVVVISERLARRFWPGHSPIGKRIQSGEENSTKPWATIVGVVADTRYDWNDREDYPMVYFPYQQEPRQFSFIVVRAEGDPRVLIPPIRAGIQAVDPDQPIYEIKTLDRVISESVVGLSYVAVIMGILGLIAMVLAAMGVYGIMAYAVVERTHEIGVRLALGAQPREIMRLILSRGTFLLALGIAIGLPVAYALARLLASLLFGVSASDAGIFSLITIFLAGVSIAACYIPAYRAMNVDPMIALRYE
jgi:putative ABC transport system permease protein